MMAKEDFENARQLEPDPAIDKELKRLKQAYSQHDAKASDRVMHDSKLPKLARARCVVLC
ncbi:unnamed protein product [Effrenium voratum]|uniref:Uncharacterized protein n=1 Tax=Effrenium voratum TaxID=2562239 RepID=A0AA36MXN1_9DINO|nr:unnamed protein product [Effrenium voratum]